MGVLILALTGIIGEQALVEGVRTMLRSEGDLAVVL